MCKPISGHHIPTTIRNIYESDKFKELQKTNPLLAIQALMMPFAGLSIDSILYAYVESAITGEPSNYLWATPLVTNAFSGGYELFRHLRKRNVDKNETKNSSCAI